MDDEVLVVIEIKGPDGMQSRHMRRTNNTHGNLVQGYYGNSYNAAASVGNDQILPPVNLTQAELNGPMTTTNVDVQKPNGKEYIKKSVHQIAGYMVAYQRKYGVLSTSEMTWLLKMEPDGRLFVSPGLNGGGGGLSTNSPRALLTSFLVHVAREAETGNPGHRLVIQDNTRFYRFLDQYWTSNLTGRDTFDVQMNKIAIIQQMKDAWLALQQAQQQAANNNNNNNNNGGGGAPGGNGQGPGNGGQQPPPAAPGAGGGGGGGNGDGIHNNAALVPGNIINNLKNTFNSVGENIFANKKSDGNSSRNALIDTLPLKKIRIGFPWELREVHPSANSLTPSIKMTVSGIPLVLKTLNKEDPYAKAYFDDEIKMYRGPLRSLQGVCAPYLFYAGDFTNGRQIFVTSREGAPLAAMSEAVLEQAFIHEAMRETLSTLHENGITHNKICLPAFHLVITNDNVRTYLTDFGNAVYSPKRTKQFIAKCDADKQMLEAVIEELVEDV